MIRTVMRIDKWLWAARFFRTRSLAQTAVEGGKVSLNGEHVKPSKEVRLGDTIEVGKGDTAREASVCGLAEKRGSALQAAKLYVESEASRLKRLAYAENRRLGVEPAANLRGRPTKQHRRSLEKLRGY